MPQTLADLGGEPGERAVDFRGGAHVGGEGPFVGDRLDARVVVDLTSIQTAGTRDEVGPVTAQDLSCRRGVQGRDVAERTEPELAEVLGGPRPDSGHRTHRKRGEERGLLAGADHRQPVGLVAVARYLRDRLARRDPHRAGDAKLGDARTDATGDRDGVLGGVAARGHVEIRLIDGDRLHPGALVGEDRAHR